MPVQLDFRAGALLCILAYPTDYIQFHDNNEYTMKARVNLWPVQLMALDTIKVNVGHIFMQDICLLVIILKFKYLR